MQERCNSIANALELCLSCTNPSTFFQLIFDEIRFLGYKSQVHILILSTKSYHVVSYTIASYLWYVYNFIHPSKCSILHMYCINIWQHMTNYVDSWYIIIMEANIRSLDAINIIHNSLECHTGSIPCLPMPWCLYHHVNSNNFINDWVSH